MITGILSRMSKATKRGYSREFPIGGKNDERIKREIDWVPPTLDRKVQAKLRREGVSLRALTLRLWKAWASE
jgi:hypothetical protein